MKAMLMKQVIPVDSSGYRQMERKPYPMRRIGSGSAFMYDAHHHLRWGIKLNVQILIKQLVIRTFYRERLKRHHF